jgi:hypothetical protein
VTGRRPIRHRIPDRPTDPIDPIDPIDATHPTIETTNL